MNRMIALAGLLLGGLVASVTASEACDFDCTVSRHLDAIQQRDFAAFESTLSASGAIDFILPSGKHSDDPMAFRSTLKEWLETPGWTFDYDVVRKHAGSDLGSVLLRVRYREADRGGRPYALDHFLLLIFRKTEDRWLLVHDQNTAIPADAPKPASE